MHWEETQRHAHSQLAMRRPNSDHAVTVLLNISSLLCCTWQLFVLCVYYFATFTTRSQNSGTHSTTVARADCESTWKQLLWIKTCVNLIGWKRVQISVQMDTKQVNDYDENLLVTFHNPPWRLTLSVQQGSGGWVQWHQWNGPSSTLETFQHHVVQWSVSGECSVGRWCVTCPHPRYYRLSPNDILQWREERWSGKRKRRDWGMRNELVWGRKWGNNFILKWDVILEEQNPVRILATTHPAYVPGRVLSGIVRLGLRPGRRVSQHAGGRRFAWSLGHQWHAATAE